MKRSTLFALGLGAAAVCAVVAVLYWAGVMPPDHQMHVKHGILFLGLALVAALFALVNRPVRIMG
jgi:hypothetical protein